MVIDNECMATCYVCDDEYPLEQLLDEGDVFGVGDEGSDYDIPDIPLEHDELI
jgi:hypothetical protein